MYESPRDERGFWRREATWLRLKIARLRIWLARVIGRRLR
ncbi:hypothetical protein BKA15_002062 [Microlunatus parietis]|uniref:Uncharacterized protein n=1 Tax=Microlunatus parietis TaxID=682979 RepID=A0A7Y9I5Z5_9ACTN|nr:hypothetical protein [Microlunatus parietis]